MQADPSQAQAQVPGPQYPGAPPAPVTAQMNFQPAGQDAPIADYQKGAIRGMAHALGYEDPLGAVQAALGPEASNIQVVDQLTNSQAIRVLTWIRDVQASRLAAQQAQG